MTSANFIDLPPLFSARGTITLPGSKSISNRILLLSALAQGTTEIRDVLLSDDTERMLDGLRTLGVGVEQLDVSTYLVLDLLAKSSSLKEFVDERPGQVHRHAGSTEKAERLLGWRARTSLEEGLARTVQWYRENEAWWRATQAASVSSS